jgi:hypothetical protein
MHCTSLHPISRMGPKRSLWCIPDLRQCITVPVLGILFRDLLLEAIMALMPCEPVPVLQDKGGHRWSASIVYDRATGDLSRLVMVQEAHTGAPHTASRSLMVCCSQPGRARASRPLWVCHEMVSTMCKLVASCMVVVAASECATRHHHLDPMYLLPCCLPTCPPRHQALHSQRADAGRCPHT